MTTHPLLAPLTEPQQAVIDIVWNVWRQNARFPVYGYVEREMDRQGLLVEAVLPTFPGIGESQLGFRYQAVCWDLLSNGAPDRTVGISIAGLTHVTDHGADSVIKVFLEILSVLAYRRSVAEPDPFAAEDPTISRSELLESLSQGRDPNLIPALFAAVQSLSGYEPPASGTGLATANDGSALLTESLIKCTRNVRHFLDVTDAADYLSRLDAYLAGPPLASTTIPEEPPLALAAELDFLDAVWRLHDDSQRSLLLVRGASPVSRLSTDAASAEEFDARLSDLAQVLKSFDLQGVSGREGRQHPVQRLVDHLQDDLHIEKGAATRISAAGAVLEAAIDVRNGGVHHNVAPKAVQGLATLGIAYPIADWCSAWRTVRSAVTRAIATLREELQADD